MASRLIFERALLREISATAGGVLVALLAILLSTQLVRLLGQAAGGQITSEAVLGLLGFAMLTYLPVILGLTLFISILLAMSRAYRDSEMIIWFSAGVSLTAWIRPVVRFSLPIVGAVAALSVGLTPWALSKSVELRQRVEARQDVSSIFPGTFRESGDSTRVFFIEQTDPETLSGRNVFVSSLQHGRLGVTVSGAGYQEIGPEGDRFIVLERGRRYEGQPGTTEYGVLEFERYAVRVESKETRVIRTSPKTLYLTELIAIWNPAAKAELLYRIGVPLAALNLALLAVPLSFVNPRAGRAHNLVFALLTYMVYNNLLNVSQAWVAQGRLSFEIGMWAVHLAMLALLLALFYRRISVYTAFRWLRLR